MLIKANGAIKSIMNKNVKTNKLNFRTKIMNKTNFSVLQEVIIDKIENLIKENQSHKSIACIVCKGRMWVFSFFALLDSDRLSSSFWLVLVDLSSQINDSSDCLTSSPKLFADDTSLFSIVQITQKRLGMVLDAKLHLKIHLQNVYKVNKTTELQKQPPKLFCKEFSFRNILVSQYS